MIDNDRILELLRETEDALSSTVKISWHETLKLVVSDLIAKRNSPTNKIKKEFDAVLKYYLGDNDFEKYVIRKVKF